jgi:tRNA dimethylallyltransferase
VAVEGGPQRMGRALEVPLLTGRSLSWWHREAPREADPVRGVIVWLDVPRDELDRRIEARVTRMLEAGLVDEVRGLVASGYTEEDPGMSGTGYREVIAYLKGEVSLDESARMIRTATRQYARRQMTWFRHQLPPHATRIDATAPIEERVAATLEAWTEALAQPDGSRRIGRFRP